MASPPQLTAAQIDEFKAEGYVIARGLIPVAVVDDWRRQVWEATTADPSWWPEGDYRGPFVGKELIASGTGMRNAAILRPELQGRLRYPYPGGKDNPNLADPYPFRPSVGEQLTPVLDQLLGPNTWAPGIAAPPDADAGIEMDVSVFNMPPQPENRVPGYDGSSHVAAGSHIEGYRGGQAGNSGKGGPTPKWQVGCSVYLDDVAPGGGGTYVWPRSHTACHRYFSKYPADIPSGGALCTSAPPAFVHGLPNVRQGVVVDGQRHTGLSVEYMKAVVPGGYDGAGPQEAVMNRGDVLIWHHWCAHSGSPNGLDSIRQLFVARFHSTAHGEAMLTDDGGVSSDGNLWKYWGPAVNDGAAGGGVSKL